MAICRHRLASSGPDGARGKMAKVAKMAKVRAPLCDGHLRQIWARDPRDSRFATWGSGASLDLVVFAGRVVRVRGLAAASPSMWVLGL
jgi:hypothetical protein